MHAIGQVPWYGPSVENIEQSDPLTDTPSTAAPFQFKGESLVRVRRRDGMALDDSPVKPPTDISSRAGGNHCIVFGFCRRQEDSVYLTSGHRLVLAICQSRRPHRHAAVSTRDLWREGSRHNSPDV